MNTVTITSYCIARGISLNWEVAHNAGNYGEWVYSWNHVESELNGIWDLVNWSLGSREAIDDILDDINTLRAIARAHARQEPDVNINRAFSGALLRETQL